uniref:Uncharacterized protein n=1 Tax=Agrobacterium vitis TaxID=373 RepID=A7XEG2_AGRVI|nr:hypothetical protein [Agrobacterium vitis]
MKTTDRVALNDWYAIATAGDVTTQPVQTRLLGQEIEYRLDATGAPMVRETGADGCYGPALPFQVKYGCLFTTLGTPGKDIVDIAEAQEADPPFCAVRAWVTMRASSLRCRSKISLDMAPFPLGAIRIFWLKNRIRKCRTICRNPPGMWMSLGTNCTFFQPGIAAIEKRWRFRSIAFRGAIAFGGDVLPGSAPHRRTVLMRLPCSSSRWKTGFAAPSRSCIWSIPSRRTGHSSIWSR